METSAFDHVLLAIDEFHHVSRDAESRLGEVLRDVLSQSSAHVIAMTGSYFRGDSVPILTPEDEARFSVIEESIELIISGEIVNFTYDDESKLICNRQ
ncbi:MAG: hypothetical protein KAH99_05205 [Verrucomicrobia bacterium]|nr:hypothetical protein [Verrucomicrobiota bacterium]